MAARSWIPVRRRSTPSRWRPRGRAASTSAERPPLPGRPPGPPPPPPRPPPPGPPAGGGAGAGLILMHMQGTPRTMQERPSYGDVVVDVRAFLAERLAAATAAGIPSEAILLDPGIGFGKTVEHNLTLLRHLPELTTLGRPLLVGPSRKSFIGAVLGTPVTDRLEGTAAAVALAIAGGGAAVRGRR